MNVTAITCTGNRPEAFALCEKYMARQLFQPAQWMVLCDGETPTACTMGQTFAHSPAWRGLGSMMAKLRFAFDSGLIKGDAVAFVEDDDWFGPDYLLRQVARMAAGLDLVGEGWAIYYNVRGRWWHRNGNKLHASLCQTMVARKLYERVRALCASDDFWLDVRLWALPCARQVFPPGVRPSLVGIKGMPGRLVQLPGKETRTGYGMGHNLKDKNGIPDPELKHLRALIGAQDAEAYAPFFIPTP